LGKETIIFKTTGVMTLADHQKSVMVPFHVDGQYDRMVIHYSYSPKELWDREEADRQLKECLDKYAPGVFAEEYAGHADCYPLRNLCCLGLTHNGVFMGNAHRHDPVQVHEFSAVSAPPGFYPCKDFEGDWVISINNHTICTETCTYQIEVRGYHDA